MKLTMCVLLTVLVSSGPVLADTYNEMPIADTWVWEGSGPWGASTTLRTNIAIYIDQEIVIAFDLSSIPSGSAVDSAFLHVYRYDGDPGSALECDIFRVTEYWEEPSLVDSIAHDDGNSYDQIVVTGNDWYTFDITQLAQDWVDGTWDNYGIVFYGTGGTGSYQYFRSREGTSDRPHLEIDYTPPGALETVTFGWIKALFR